MGRVQGAQVISLPSAAVADLRQLLNATQSLPTLVDRNIVANRYDVDVGKVTRITVALPAGEPPVADPK